MAKVRLSKKYSLSIPDYVRGALLAAGSTALVFVQEWLDKESEPFNFRLLIKVSVGVFISYILKNGVFEKPKTIITAETNNRAEIVSDRVKEVV